MDDKKVAEWALERAVDLYHCETIFSSDIAVIYKYALARYITEHEDPPVDPLSVEARALLAEWPSEAGFEDFTLKALRRGMELARKEDSHA